tara:strand:+ start:283 stop:666 length:384 start_codon:yes stop_codon:yes gene_type:complete
MEMTTRLDSVGNTYQEPFEPYFDKMIDKWLDDRGITKNGTSMGQAIKTLEETTELLDAINHNDEAAVIDAVGDIYVTLRGVCKVRGIQFDKCVQAAYNEIKDRKGHLTSGGTFIKETKSEERISSSN